MKNVLAALLLMSVFTSSAFADSATCQDHGPTGNTLTIAWTKSRWKFQVNSRSGKEIIRTSFKPSEIQATFCDQSFKNDEGFSGISNYCKTLFSVNLTTPTGRNLSFQCEGIFTTR